jgi:hypothetical protein
MRKLAFYAFGATLLFLGAASGQTSNPTSGTLLVVDATAGTGQLGALFTVSPSNGSRALLSDFGSSSQGVTGVDPDGVAWAPAILLGPPAAVLVTDGSAGTNGLGALFSVNPYTGNRTLISDFGDTNQGPLGSYPVDITVIPSLLANTILVMDAYAGTNGQGALFSVNQVTGSRTLVSDFGLSAQGVEGVYPDSIVLLPSPLLGLGSSYLATDGSGGTNGLGALYGINPANGNRSLLSDFGNAAQGPVDPDLNSFPNATSVIRGGLLGPDPLALITDASAGTNDHGQLLSVDTATGTRHLISDFGNPAEGPLGVDPDGVLWIPSTSTVLVVDGSAGTGGLGAIFSVSMSTGSRALVSDFGNPAQGSILGSYPNGIAVVP